MSVKRTAVPNQLLALLPRKDRDVFFADCSEVTLAFGTVLHEPGDPIRHVYFPTDSIISLLTIVDAQSVLEVGMIGNEGMCGLAAILGGHIEPSRALVQGAGPAWRMSIMAFMRHMTMLPTLRPLLLRYANIVLCQLFQTAACTRFHLVEARLARWLLMTQDRAHADAFIVTQEFLAFMLGVRRAGVTKAAGMLQSMKLIHYTRGHLEILDRKMLEHAACACYSDDLASYARGLPEPLLTARRSIATHAQVR